MNLCIYIFSCRIMAGTIVRNEILLLSKLPCIVLVCVYVFLYIYLLVLILKLAFGILNKHVNK
jgi:hypothetical protein